MPPAETTVRTVATADDQPVGLPTGLALAWGLRPAASRGPKPGLSLEQIVATAIELADEGGLAAVSMSKLAEALGFTTMSLYRYVRAKDDLILLMNDTALGDPPFTPDETTGWRDAADRWARTLLARYREHPWTLDVPITGVPAVPHQLLWLDRILQALDGTNLSYQEKLSTTLLLSGYVRDWATLSRGVLAGEEARAASDEAAVSFSDSIGQLLDTERYPALAPMIAAGEFDDDDDDFDDVFDFSLERILDGIEVFIDARAKQAKVKVREPKPKRRAR